MSVHHRDATASLLPDGRIMIAGGQDPTGTTPQGGLPILNVADFYDPATGTWTSGTMTTGRVFDTATSLPDGRVLIAGGQVSQGIADSYYPSTASAEIFAPSSNTFTQVASMHDGRRAFAAALLPDGRVLVAGGLAGGGGTGGTRVLSSAEIYDPATNTWTLTASMPTPWWAESAVTLGNGNVFIGGAGCTLGGNTAEIYTP